MTKADLLVLLKADLNMLNIDDKRTKQLLHLIDAAEQMIGREGIKFSCPYSAEDGSLIIMYAAYLYRKRITDEGMPRMLRWAMNNRLFAQKAGDGDAT